MTCSSDVEDCEIASALSNLSKKRRVSKAGTKNTLSAISERQAQADMEKAIGEIASTLKERPHLVNVIRGVLNAKMAEEKKQGLARG
eukprot:799190-Lingulodinium_polyedra.AAC.1